MNDNSEADDEFDQEGKDSDDNNDDLIITWCNRNWRMEFRTLDFFRDLSRLWEGECTVYICIIYLRARITNMTF